MRNPCYTSNLLLFDEIRSTIQAFESLNGVKVENRPALLRKTYQKLAAGRNLLKIPTCFKSNFKFTKRILTAA